MHLKKDPNNPDLNIDDVISGFAVRKIVEVEENNYFFYELEHLDIGSRYVHISNNDRENTFSVAFKTVPADSTGVAHILEHTVLCGSQKFPVRDPFFSMLRRSLSTFMNAFTASDWTMYPFSTQNRKDFYNLMDVYLDSAFYPNIDELSFKQEGHRLEVEGDINTSKAWRLVYKGVVYNEMKGAMSSPNQVMGRSILNALYPETTYRYNSGGDPAVMPNLTYDQLKGFHRRHYHPSNAYFYTYGHLPLREHLRFISEKILSHFERIDPRTEVPSQPRWSRPKTLTYTYPFGQNEDPSRKCQVCVAWLTADIHDAFEVLILALLSQILIGNPASPLRKALIDSKLGSALSDGTGFDSDNRDTLFACGLKDVNDADAGRIETIIFDVLKELVEHGVDRQMIEAAIHQLEFHRKEVTNTPYPYGIQLLLTFGGTWFHGGDPVRILKFDADIQRLRREMAEGPLFENRIQRYFLDNPHRVLLTLAPDQQMEQKERERVVAELESVRASLPPGDIAKIIEDAKALEKLQEKKEDVSCLPTLALEDIPPTVQKVDATASYDPAAATCYQQPTSGIFYFTAAAGCGWLPDRLIPMVPFFCYAFSKIGTQVRDYTEMARLIDAYTGGVRMSCQARTGFNASADCLPLAVFSGKCLVRNLEKLFEIIEELFLKFDFSDLNRLKSLFLEYRAGLESMVVQNGHRLAMSLASRNFSTTQALNEAWHGIYQLQTIKTITNDLNDQRLESVAQDLASIGRYIFKQDNLKIALIGEDTVIPEAYSAAAAIRQGLAKAPDKMGLAHGFLSPKLEIVDETPREGWSTSTAVSFVARTFMTVRMDHEDAAALFVISKLLRSLYLHREIREKGGAYGGFAIYNRENGLFSFGSYRDPHIVTTLKVYDNALNFIKSQSYSDEDVKESILQACSELDKPDPPGPAARNAFYRKIVSLSDDTRERFKKNLLAVGRREVLGAAEKYFNDPARHAVAVISSQDQLKAANEALADRPLRLFNI